MATMDQSSTVETLKTVCVFDEKDWPLLTDLWEAVFYATDGFSHPVECEVDFIARRVKLPYEKGRRPKYIRSGEFYVEKPDPGHLRFCTLTRGIENEAIRLISRNLWERWNVKGKRPGDWDISKLLSARLAAANADVYKEGEAVVRAVKGAVLWVFIENLYQFEQFLSAQFPNVSVPKEFIERVQKLLNEELDQWPDTPGRRAVFTALDNWLKKVDTFEVPTLWYALYLLGCNLDDPEDIVRGIIARDAKALARQKTYQASGNKELERLEQTGVVSTHDAQDQKVIVVRGNRALAKTSVSRRDAGIVIDLQPRGFENMYVGVNAGLHSGLDLGDCLAALQSQIPDGKWEGAGTKILFFCTRRPINRGMLEQVLTVILESVTAREQTPQQHKTQTVKSTKWVDQLEDAKWVNKPTTPIWVAASNPPLSSPAEPDEEEDPIQKMVRSLVNREGDIDVMSMPAPKKRKPGARAPMKKDPNPN